MTLNPQEIGLPKIIVLASRPCKKRLYSNQTTFTQNISESEICKVVYENKNILNLETDFCKILAFYS